MRPEEELHPGDGYGGNGVHFFPPSADSSLIFLHGRGDSGEGWGVLAGLLDSREALRGRVRLILPTADRIHITKYDIECNAWFDSRSERRDIDEDAKGFERSHRRVQHLIQQEIQNGIKPSRIIVAGFSQGGAMAYYTPLRSDTPLAAAICLSGWCPFLHDLIVQKAFASGNCQFMHMHGVADTVVDYSFARQSYEAAVEATKKAAAAAAADPATVASRFEFKTYERLGHESNAKEMADFLHFIERCLAKNT
ncbi:Acyl-protein thioesterase 1, related [Eimeria tenella]|uniref:Acyl-protein thioesterase 1, related n=1 Tax=Eimeria tenella TaxID=5802 RepID=U6L2S2_EIMTE|nr:Acyl-protein thioesterase 1, related [Eimeria tenella]CDJ42070.1 Acyl-protein thioesterase 1, related [Eimeria tenella]|eukprot:XP_013232820.1 Acyl-protein thioesterase 1, related [Eimeria tenella]